METIINALSSLIQTISRNLLSSILLMISMLLIALGLFAHFNLSHLVDRFPSVAQEQNSFNRSVILNDLIITELQDVQRYIGADRVNLNQFRNGQFDLTGVPFNFAAITFSAAAPGVSLDDRFTVPVPLSVYNDLIPHMWNDLHNPNCVSKNIEQIAHPVLRFRLQERGTQMIYACPVLTPTGAAVGFITAEYLRRESRRPTEEILFERIRISASRTVGYLIRTMPRI